MKKSTSINYFDYIEVIEVPTTANYQSWDSVLFWYWRYHIRYLKTGHSVSVFRYSPKTGHCYRYFGIGIGT